MSTVNVQVNPSYLCNFRCHFCYLTEEQLSSKDLIPLEKIEGYLKEITQYREIDIIDLYGGEISLLPKGYVEELLPLLVSYCNRFNALTNLSTIRDWFYYPFINLCISYDFDAREQHDKVFNNLLELTSNGRSFALNLLATPHVMSLDTDEMAKKLSLLTTLEVVEVKPYSTNQANSFNYSFLDYQEFLIRFIDSCTKYNVPCNNLELVYLALEGETHDYTSSNLFISPTGLAVLDFDLNGREYFRHFPDFPSVLKWGEREEERIKHSFCGYCKYLNRCLTEHLGEVKNLDNGCSGLYHLLEHYENKGSKTL